MSLINDGKGISDRLALYSDLFQDRQGLVKDPTLSGIAAAQSIFVTARQSSARCVPDQGRRFSYESVSHQCDRHDAPLDPPPDPDIPPTYRS